jgi:catechol 2,3-dioxygenase-like lactoylglutathione lyase family enzyme
LLVNKASFYCFGLKKNACSNIIQKRIKRINDDSSLAIMKAEPLGNSMYKGYGVHHCVIGVKNLETMKSFYQGLLEFTDVFTEFPEDEYEPLSEVTRTFRPRYVGLLFSQAAGGIIIGLTQMIDPVARPIRKDFKYGDIGVAKITIAVSDLEILYSELKERLNFCSRPKSVLIPKLGDCRFVYCRDPEGNLIEFVSGENLPVRGRFGGVRWLGVSVTDLSRSLAFYQKYLGFDSVVINVHEEFSGLVDEISGCKQTKVRSCVLASRQGDGMVELFEVMQPRGRSIPFSTRWGDFGYTQVCLNGKAGADIYQIADYFEKEGMEFLSRPQLMHDEKGGGFFYMKDPDGIPIEFLVFNQ